MTSSTYLEGVRDQYEDYPYPLRDPNAEKTELRPTVLEFLDYLNFKCFRGEQNYSGFRALVAGGGTGDAAIFLAEQLRDRDAEIVYLDISSASRKIAQERAQVRGLDNITWIQGSILDLPEMDIGRFDYINCCGVLHHLESPVAGLMALKSVLGEKGCMGLMVYGAIGRTAIYQMQELMRLINSGEQSAQTRVDNTKTLIKGLPASNWFKLSEQLTPADHINHGDAGIYDMFLHQQDRAYTVPELFEFIDQCGLEFVDFAYRSRWRYQPGTYLNKSPLMGKLEKLDTRKQYAIAELVAGNIFVHSFYVSRIKDTVASLDNIDNIPFFSMVNIDCESLSREMQNNPGRQVVLSPAKNINITLPTGKYTHLIFKYLDGKRSLRKIFKKIKKELGKSSVSDIDLLSDFAPTYQSLNDADWLLLRSPSARPIKDFAQMQEPVSRRYQGA